MSSIAQEQCKRYAWVTTEFEIKQEKVLYMKQD